MDSNQSPWFAQLLIGIEKELARRESSLMLSTLESGVRSGPKVALEWIRDHRIDGLVIVKFTARERPLLAESQRLHIPTVLIAPRVPAPHHRVVRSDNFRAGITLANHLADMGHKRIAFEGGVVYLDLKDRLRGLRSGAGRCGGITLDSKQISFCGKFEPEAGMEFANRFFKRSPRPERPSVLGNDSLALGFMRVAHQRGIRIPLDISVAGFDDIPESGLVWPGLTTVAQPIGERWASSPASTFSLFAFAKRRRAIEFPMRLVVREVLGLPQSLPRRCWSENGTGCNPKCPREFPYREEALRQAPEVTSKPLLEMTGDLADQIRTVKERRKPDPRSLLVPAWVAIGSQPVEDTRSGGICLLRTRAP